MILDLMMPELNGIDLLAQIRQTDDDVAIIILTGHPSLETAISPESSATPADDSVNPYPCRNMVSFSK